MCIRFRGNIFTEPLPGNDRDTDTHRLMGRVMKYSFKMGSDAIIYVSCFIIISSGIQKLIREYTNTQTA
jgi:hypothetical protein